MKNFLFALALVCAFSFTALAQAPNSNYNEQGGLNTVIGGTLTVTGSIVAAYEDLTAAGTLDSTDCGSTKFLNAATEFATTLPSPTAGCAITFVDGTAVVGDYVTLFSDGTSWYLHGQANADGGVTVTKAS